jgi:hypothetical protein
MPNWLTCRKISVVNSDVPDYQHRFRDVPPSVLRNVLQASDRDVVSLCVSPFGSLLDACLTALHPGWELIAGPDRIGLGAKIIARVCGQSIESMSDERTVAALSAAFKVNIVAFPSSWLCAPVSNLPCIVLVTTHTGSGIPRTWGVLHDRDGSMVLSPNSTFDVALLDAVHASI